MNFGTLKDIFSSILIESQLSNTEGGKNLYKKFLKLIKEDEILKSQFIIYKNIEDKHFDSEVTASDYLKENISVIKKWKKSEIESSNKKLIKLLESSDLKPKNFKTKKLHNSLHTLMTENKSAVNINKLHNSFEVVKSNLMEEKTTEEKNDYVREGVDPNLFLDIAVKKFNEKYSDLTEEEKRIFKVLKERDEEAIKTLTNELVEENLLLVNKNLELFGENLSIKEKLLETKDVIYKMKEDNNSFGENVLKLLKLKSSLRNDS
jgi:hypothetical protein